jgi:hypothetical protein
LRLSLPATAEEATLATEQKPEPRAFTINQWCARWGYSRVHFYKLRGAGNAPEVIGTGKAQRISLESESRWLKRQERLAKRWVSCDSNCNRIKKTRGMGQAFIWSRATATGRQC